MEWKVPGAPAERAEIELYDYENDLLETKNLAAPQPEIVARLRCILPGRVHLLRSDPFHGTMKFLLILAMKSMLTVRRLTPNNSARSFVRRQARGLQPAG